MDVRAQMGRTEMTEEQYPNLKKRATVQLQPTAVLEECWPSVDKSSSFSGEGGNIEFLFLIPRAIQTT